MSWLTDVSEGNILQDQPTSEFTLEEASSILDEDLDWLNEIPADDAENEDQPRAEEKTEWLNVDPVSEEPAVIEETSLESEFTQEEIPEWLTSLEPEGETVNATEEEFTLEGIGESEDIDWIASETSEQESVALHQAFDSQEAENTGETSEYIAEPPTLNTTEEDDEFSWLEENDEPLIYNAEENEPEFLQEIEEFTSETPSAHAWTETPALETSSETDDVFPVADSYSEYSTTPAENAPDWLNAMVPGIDVDTEAEEDLPIETEFADENTKQAPVAEEDFNWLTDIVDEESRPLETQSSRPSRFSFTKRPAWFRKDNSGQSE